MVIFSTLKVSYSYDAGLLAHSLVGLQEKADG